MPGRPLTALRLREYRRKMLAMVLAAGIAYPAAGTYTYEIDTPSGKTYTTTVSIATAAKGVTTHESFGAPETTATTDQTFDPELHERSFAARQGRNAVTITFSADAAIYHVGSQTIRAPLDVPDCVLVDDNVLTELVMLPAVIRATGASQCTYVVSSRVRSIEGDIVDTPAGSPPARSAKGDAAITVDLEGLHETAWYDPHTLIPDYIDFGANNGFAVLTSLLRGRPANQ